MGEFDDFTRQLRDQHQTKADEYAANEERKRQERTAEWDRQKATLEQVTANIFAEATRACHAQGIRVVVGTNWSHGDITDPVIEFQVFGPKKRPFDDSTYEVSSNKALFRVDNGRVVAKVVKQAYASNVGVDYVGYDDDGARQATKAVIASYFDEISPERS
ncbi:hypothetical protein [Sphingomonas aracearum]|uniref:Uncharacterized protein n=1 Tax=Sphingomonas aracearum TaxID=2283317 RepID=A0A369VV67_9SPHN|nr:hypothetical protein [Sphingomonas aracearum]RDE06228.1 hypothetical protein DVW87_00360 [Sphingomonas aracearum]